MRTQSTQLCSCGCGAFTLLDKRGKPQRSLFNHHSPRPIAERFWPKIICDMKTGCWLWTAAHDAASYGKLGAGRAGEGLLKASHVSWELHYGPIQEGLWVLHHCDNPPCVRPDHLFLGTAADNTADMWQKGRGRSSPVSAWAALVGHPELRRRGERHQNAKLTEEQVRRIRARRAKGEYVTTLAAEYGVTASLISQIARRTSWSHIA